jgi:hypothetical protein
MKKITQQYPMKYPLIKRLLIFLFLFQVSQLQASLYYELSIAEKATKSHYIVEGSVSFIKVTRDINNQIVTRYTVEIARKFKTDNPILNAVEITTSGGVTDGEAAIGDCFHYPKINDYGIFYIQKKNGEFRLFGEKQGFININKGNSDYSDFFHLYPDGENSYLPLLLAHCPNAELNNLTFNNSAPKNIAMVNITSIQPLIETAGTGSLLTIKGIGLGANQSNGTLYFTNADDGGFSLFSLPNELITKWTDTEIVAKIPAKAGTGKIRVETASGFDVSSQTLTIKAARMNTGESSILYESRLVKRNPNGGYLLNKNEKFALDENSALSIKNALTKWRCQTGVNWTIGKNTLISGTYRDTVNTISFDDKGQLPAGAIGLCYSYYKSCGSNVWYLDEFDMIFKEDFNWHYGDGNPAANQYDFFTVALHEFGHAHQLGHVIKPTDLMHYSISPGEQKRDISNENSDLCYEIVSESVSKNTCDFAAHLSIPQSVCTDERFGFFSPLIYPNPANGQFNVELYFNDKSTVTLQLFRVNGQLVFEKQYTPPNPERIAIDIPMQENNLNAGVYVLKIFGEFEMATQKIILY